MTQSAPCSSTASALRVCGSSSRRSHSDPAHEPSVQYDSRTSVDLRSVRDRRDDESTPAFRWNAR